MEKILDREEQIENIDNTLSTSWNYIIKTNIIAFIFSLLAFKFYESKFIFIGILLFLCILNFIPFCITLILNKREYWKKLIFISIFYLGIAFIYGLIKMINFMIVTSSHNIH
ncbi:hypothetical protein ACE193_22475 [Bernardetia sp. OM2101]|uniref:hypothetical protein n=1 Tax=Bernardetia sp. OM2101 TaxID=3344876 RepID=UPI0035D01572